MEGKPTGSVRISFGYMSAESDANKFLEMIENCFVSGPTVRKVTQNVDHGLCNLTHFISNDLTEMSKEKSNYPPISRPLECIISVNSESYEKFKPRGRLSDILLYPIKSCGAFSVSQWPISAKGLKYDREWMITNSQGTAFTQKSSKKLCLLKPIIDLEKRVMQMKFDGK